MKRKKNLLLMTFLVGFIAFIAFQGGCVDRVSSSLGLTCKHDSDCWDNLSCKNELCGGERRPIPTEDTEETVVEKVAEDAGATQPEPEPVKETSVVKDLGSPDQGTNPPEKANESKPEKVKEPIPEKPKTQCKGNLDPMMGTCQKDSDCCSGQKCTKIEVPKMGTFHVCGTCQDTVDCPQGTICCPNHLCTKRCTPP